MPDDLQRLAQILDALALPKDQYIVAGSGAMILAGIERDRPMGDVDIFCTTRLWFEMFAGTWGVFTTDPYDLTTRCDPPYLYRQLFGLEVNVFSQWRRRGVGDIDVAFWLANAVEQRGFPCVNLSFLLDWKLTVGRSKDVSDVALLQEYLGVEGSIS